MSRFYTTSGSNELGSKRLIKTITDVYSAGPRDVKGRLKKPTFNLP